MAYTGTIVTSAEMIFMAGENINTTGSVEANWNYLAYYAEAYLSTLVKYDIVTNWATMKANYKRLFTDWAARYSAVALIQYNMLGDGGNTKSRISSEDQINIHVYQMKRIEKLLLTAGTQDFIEVNS